MRSGSRLRPDKEDDVQMSNANPGRTGHDPGRSEYADRMNGLRAELRSLPDNTDAEIQRTAETLESLNYSFDLGAIELDLMRFRMADLEREFDRIDRWGFEEAVANRNFEPEYTGGDREEYTREFKLSRMKLLLEKYRFLCRLRSDEPEAWDVVNELYYDD